MNEFEMKAYSSQFDTALAILPDVTSVVEDEKREPKIYKSWQEFNEALKKRQVDLNDQIYESEENCFYITEIAYYFEDIDEKPGLKITPKYKYEKIK